MAGLTTTTVAAVADDVTFKDGNGNETLVLKETASAENHVQVQNAADGNGPTISAIGDDTNVDLNVAAKGSGVVNVTSDMKITGTTPTLTVGDAGAEDTMIVFDGNAADFRIGLDDGTDSLEIGAGSAHGTTAGLVINSSGQVTGIGDDTPSNEQVLTWTTSGTARAVWATASTGGEADSVAADNISDGNAAVNIITTSGDITIDAQANDADVIIKVDDAGSSVTAVTFDGSDEGNAIFVNDLKLQSDASVIHFGANDEITMTHVHNSGLTITNTVNGTDDSPVILTLKSEEDAIVADDVIGTINFTAGDSDGTDGAAIAASIEALAEDTFSASVNETSLIFKTGASEAAVEKARLWSDGMLELTDCVSVAGAFAAIQGAGSYGVMDYASNHTRIISRGANGSTLGGITLVQEANDASPSQNTLVLDTSGNAAFLADLSVGDDLSLVSDSAVLSFGAGSETTLTHTNDVGLALRQTGANAIQWKILQNNATDGWGFHADSSDGKMKISRISASQTGFFSVSSEGAAELEGESASLVIDNDATDADPMVQFALSGTVKWSVGCEDGDSDKFVIENGAGALGAAPALEIDSSSNVTVTGDVNVGDDLTLTSDASVLTFGAGSDVTFTHDNGTGMDITSAGNLDIDCTAGSITLGASLADGQTLKLGKNGAVETIIAPHGTAGSELYSVINTSGVTDGTDAAGSILLSAVAGGIGLAWADTKDLWAEGGAMSFVANENRANAIHLHADAGADQTILLQNDEGTGTGADDGSSAIQLHSGAGGIGITCAATKKLYMDAGTFTLKTSQNDSGAILLHADEGTAQVIKLVNDEGNTDGTAGAGAIDIEATAGGISLLWADTKDLWAEGGQAMIVANHNTANAIKLHADAGAAQTIQILNDEGTVDGTAGAGAIDIEATAGGMSLLWADTKDLWAEGGAIMLVANENKASAIQIHADAGANQTIQIINDEGSVEGTYGSGAIDIEATAGGISLLWNDAKDLWAEGGQFIVTANHDTADCIKLHADAGTSQQITVLNDAGTNAAAIGLTASAGGISLTSAATTATDGVTITASQTTKDAVQITANSLTTAYGIDMEADALTTGGLARFVSNASSDDNRSLVTIDAEHANSDNVVPLDISNACTHADGNIIARFTGPLDGLNVKTKQVILNSVNHGSNFWVDASNFFPAGCTVLGLTAKVTTVIPASKYISQIGIVQGGTPDLDAFGVFANAATLGAEDTSAKMVPRVFLDHSAQADLRITFDGNPGATSGVIRVTLFYTDQVPG